MDRGKPKKSRISVIRNDEFVELDDADILAIVAMENKQKRRAAAKLEGKLTYKGRPLPDHIQKAIDEADRKARNLQEDGE